MTSETERQNVKRWGRGITSTIDDLRALKAILNSMKL